MEADVCGCGCQEEIPVLAWIGQHASNEAEEENRRAYMARKTTRTASEDAAHG